MRIAGYFSPPPAGLKDAQPSRGIETAAFTAAANLAISGLKDAQPSRGIETSPGRGEGRDDGV